MSILILVLAIAAIIGGAVLVQRGSTAIGVVLIVLGAFAALYGFLGVH